MISYTFKCKECGHMFESSQTMRDDSTPPCPECKSRDTRKVITGMQFILKCGGFASKS